MKNRIAVVVLASLMLFGGCANGGMNISQNAETLQTVMSDETKLDEVVGNAVIENLKEGYLEGETACEGHIILGNENRENKKLVIYALCSSGFYGFENNNFVKVSGSGVIPAKITFLIDKGELVTESYEEPADGSGYDESVKKLFPAIYADSVMSISEEDSKACFDMERVQAEAYLKEIGREAKIGDYGDFEHILLTDKGVSNDVSDLIARDEEFSEYPMFIGTREAIEGGERFVYCTDYDENNHQIILSKIKAQSPDSNYEEYITVDSVTGEISR